MRFRLLVFDLDGTLVDTADDITDSINYALTMYGLKPVNVDFVKEALGGGASIFVSKTLEKQGARKDQFEKILNTFLAHYDSNLLNKTRPYPDVRDFLEATPSYIKCILSNKREKSTKMVVEGLNIKHYFKYIAGSDTFTTKKPDPQGLLWIISKFNVPRKECLMIGDSDIDIKTARAVGIKICCVTYGYSTIGRINSADYLISSIKKLFEII